MQTAILTSKDVTPIAANFHSIYERSVIEERIAKLNGVEDGQLRDVYERMLSKGPERFQVRPTGTLRIDPMYDALPNFCDALDDIKRQVALCQDSQDGLDITPILLLGEPGIGKTHFAKKIADLLGTGMGIIPMGQVTAGWLLSGSSAQWKGGKPGKVFENLVYGEYANPVLVVDEIDKANSDTQYDPLGSLYSLLEQETSSAFIDEFANVPIDASKVIWVCTANDERPVPKPILNRMNIFEIEKPTIGQARVIANNLYTSIRTDHSWGKDFDVEPNSDLLDALAEIGPREMRKALMVGFGNAKLQKMGTVAPRHLPQPKNKKTSIGFMN